jgi:hypothetical protein
MKNLYETLGVAKDAAASAIKQAYRKLAKQAHPDVGGNPDDFRALTLAYSTLSDDDKRRHYDETGQTDDRVDTVHARALSVIGGMVDNLSVSINMRDDLVYDDLAKLLRDALAEQVKSAKSNKTEAEKFVIRATKIAKRFSAKTGENYVGNMLERNVGLAKQSVQVAKERLDVLNAASEILADVSFEVEPKPHSDFGLSEFAQYEYNKISGNKVHSSLSGIRVRGGS